MSDKTYPQPVHRRLLRASTQPDGAHEWDSLFMKHEYEEILWAWEDLVKHGLLDGDTLTATDEGKEALRAWMPGRAA